MGALKKSQLAKVLMNNTFTNTGVGKFAHNCFLFSLFCPLCSPARIRFYAIIITSTRIGWLRVRVTSFDSNPFVNVKARLNNLKNKFFVLKLFIFFNYVSLKIVSEEYLISKIQDLKTFSDIIKTNKSTQRPLIRKISKFQENTFSF